MGKKGKKAADKPGAAGSDSDGEQEPKPSTSVGAGSGSSSDEDSGGGAETRGKILQRHKKEMLAHKNNMKRMGKKSKDEIAKLNQEIEDRHARELKEFDDKAAAASAAADAVKTSCIVAEVAAAGQQQEKEPAVTKAMKRRAKQEKEAAERAVRIAEELAGMGPSDRAREEERLAELLKPMGLTVREIRADGHCMYRALADQLEQTGGPTGPDAFQELRNKAAAHIRAHPDDFIPFIYDEDEEGDPAEQLEAHCQDLESTATWGGQLELGALAQVLKRQIKVYTLGMPALTLGDEFAGQGQPLQLCYLRHAFGLGEHYNSVEKLAAAAE